MMWPLHVLPLLVVTRTRIEAGSQGQTSESVTWFKSLVT